MLCFICIIYKTLTFISSVNFVDVLVILFFILFLFNYSCLNSFQINAKGNYYTDCLAKHLK